MPDDRLPPRPVAAPVEVEDEDRFEAREYGLEDYVTLVLFWILLVVVFLQFFSRYVMGDSIAWTEEMARYFLIMVGFLGSAMAVRKNSHIAVEFFYRYLPGRLGLAVSACVDVARILFLAAASWITYKLADRTGAMMVSVDIPKSSLYYVVCLAFLLMLVRSIQVAIRHWRGGTNELLFTDDDR